MTNPTAAGPDLPDGFDDAPHDVQVALLETVQNTDLVAGICAELGLEPPRGGQLPKRHKARIYLRLRDTGQVLDETESHSAGELSSEFDRVVEHDQGAEAEADGGAVAVAPASWVADAATSVVHESPGTVRAMQQESVIEETHACPDCGKEFDKGNSLSAHVNTPQTDCTWDGDGGDDLVADAPPLPSWLGRDPNDILAGAPTGRSLSEVIEIVATADTIMDAHTRLDSTTIGQARGGILGPLGLTGPNGDLPDANTLDERLTVLSEWIDDD